LGLTTKAGRDIRAALDAKRPIVSTIAASPRRVNYGIRS
jgi:hypothetical protein